MLKSRRFVSVFVVAVLAALLAVVAPVSAGGEKADVCHVNGQGDFNLINISDNAFDNHVAHGDGTPGGVVPGMDGYVFGDDCQPVEAVCEDATVTGTIPDSGQLWSIQSPVQLVLPPDGFTAIYDPDAVQGENYIVTIPATFDDGSGITWDLKDGPVTFYMHIWGEEHLQWYYFTSDPFDVTCGAHLTDINFVNKTDAPYP